jgi:WD40 repeat protein/energy-coupling factor transporter ATP-binding protein EcfA2
MIWSLDRTNFDRNIAVVIGIDNYQNGIHQLKTAVNDARAIADLLEKEYEYQEVIRLFPEHGEATLAEINKLLFETLPNEIQPTEGDRLIFYFAGHGVATNSQDGPEGFIIPQDAELGKNETFLRMSDLIKSLSQLDVHHLLVILDCCFAGSLRWSTTRNVITVPQTIHRERYDRFIQCGARQSITSAAYNQEALDFVSDLRDGSNNSNHSPFALALLDGLTQLKADFTKDGVITTPELYLYLRDRLISKDGYTELQTPGIWPLQKHDRGEFIFTLPSFERDRLQPAPPLDASINPYQGLKSFEEDQSELFFGRSELVKKLQNFVKKHRFTVVLGASGSGKSSLVKAGLIPRLRNPKETTEQWSILQPIRPGKTPLQALNNALKEAQLPEVKPQDPQQNLAQSIDVWTKRNPNSKLLLFIDQTEEIITLCPKEDKRKEFIQQILVAIDTHWDKLRVVLSLRSDFEPQIRDASLKFLPKDYSVKHTELKNRWQNGRFIVPAMTRGELRDAIEKPAEARVMFFQSPKLVEQLIDEVAGMPGALPLLSFTLSELYLKYLKRQQEAQNEGKIIERSLTQEDYKDLGGVILSLTQRVDKEYEALVKKNPAYDQIIRQVMLRMVALGGGELARRRVPLRELEYPPEKNNLAEAVIERFTKERLLVQGDDAEGSRYVEPAHDALVRNWQRLLEWKQEEEERLLLQRRLTPAAMDWDSVKNNYKEQPKGILDKAAPVLDWLDRQLFKVENLVSKIPDGFAQLLPGAPKEAERSTGKPVEFLWPDNPYLNELDKELKSDNNWFNQVEAKFVRESVLQKRQNISWRWRIAGVVAFVITTTAIVASVQWISAERRLISTINALTEASQEQFDLHKEFDALLVSLKAGKLAKQAAFGVRPEMEYQIKTQLQQAAYWVNERNRLEGDEAAFVSVSLSPDGRLLASGSADGSIKLWDVATGRPIKTLTRHIDAVHVVSFSPDGQLLAFASSASHTVKLWDITTSTEIFSSNQYDSDGNGNKGISFSLDGRLFAYASNKTIRLLNVERREEIPELVGHQDSVNGISFSPDGKMLASGSLDGTVKLWNLATSQVIDTLDGGNWVFAVSFSPDGKMLAAGANGGGIKLWNLANRKSKPYDLHAPDRVTNLSFSPNGQLLIASGFYKDIKLWNVARREEIKPLTGHRSNVNSVSVSLDGQLLDGPLLASASSDTTIKLWDVGRRKEINLLSGSNAGVTSLSSSPNGRLLASARWKSINLWDIKEGKLSCNFEWHPGLKSIAFSRSGKLLASASDHKTIKLWNVATCEEIALLKGHTNWVFSVSFSPDERLLASASWNGDVKLWDITAPEKPKEIANIQEYKGSVFSVSFSPNGGLLASAGGDKTIKLWDITNPEKPKKIANLEGHHQRLRSVNFSPDGKWLASGGEDATIKLWDVATPKEAKEVATLRGHKLTIQGVSFSSDSKLLASASDDRTIRIWDVAKRKEINVLNGHRTEVSSISFSSDKQLLASGDNSGKVAVWNYAEIMSNFTLDKLLERSCDRLRGYLENNPNVEESDRHLCDGIRNSHP